MVGGMLACAPMAPAYERGILHVAMTDGVVRAVDASTAVANWSTPLEGTIDPGRGQPQPVIANGVVYVGLTNPSPHVVALDAVTGEVLRSFGVRGTRTQLDDRPGPRPLRDRVRSGGCVAAAVGEGNYIWPRNHRRGSVALSEN